ncbi:hypothetical protein C1H84_16230 [Glutamicibacter soli]|uniref:DUF4760 domain-containing protein n=2 Tax=Glutamicibacter soli TaxID=453836 RepID=A0A365Y9A8_9MICC|nr:hypothetical protein C1H84_16230 [Glutamicibacter soli]
MSHFWKFWLWSAETWAALTAVGTILLAVFAYTAWRTSRKSLSAAVDDAKEARELAIASMDAQRRSEEVSAMAHYMQALTDLSEIHSRSPASYHVPAGGDNYMVTMRTDLGFPSYVGDLCRRVEVSGALWRINHPEIDGALSEFAAFEFAFTESVKIWAKRRNEDGLGDDLHELNFLFGKILASNVRDWQSLPTHRSNIEKLLPSQRSYFEDEIKTLTGETMRQ